MLVRFGFLETYSAQTTFEATVTIMLDVDLVRDEETALYALG